MVNGSGEARATTSFQQQTVAELDSAKAITGNADSVEATSVPVTDRRTTSIANLRLKAKQFQEKIVESLAPV